MFGQLSIEPERFARERGELQGVLSLAEMPRIAEQLFDLIGDIRYCVRGHLTEQGNPALAIKITGGVNLRCERCLERLQFGLRLGREVVFARGTDEFQPRDDEDDLVDVVPAVPRLDLQALLEEEVMLGLPMAPRHAEGECHAPSTAGGGEERQPSAFAALAKLKQ
jgi:uncharacterized protein